MSRGRGKRQGGTCDGVLGCHFAEEEEGDVHDETDDGVADEHARWTTLCERLASSEKETCTDSASDGDHLHLAGRQTAMKTRHDRRGERVVHVI